MIFLTIAECMRSAFWGVVHKCKFQEFYLEKYLQHITRIDSCLAGFTSLVSAASIAGWSVWKEFPQFWSALLMLSQIVLVVRPLLPYSRRLSALKFLVPEVRSLAREAEIAWMDADGNESVDYLPKIDSFSGRLLAIESKYLGSDVLPRIKRLSNQAEEETANHFRLIFGNDTDE